jgi:hypothetical protein
MEMMKVLVMMVMIPMNPGSMMMTMAMISLLQEGISLAHFCLPESFLSVCFLPRRGGGVYMRSLLGLRFSGGRYTRGGASRGGTGRPHPQVAWPRAGLRHQVVWAPSGSPRPLLLATSVFRWNMNFSLFSWNCWSSEIWCLDGPFSSRILTPAVNSPIIIKHVKIGKTT